MKKVLLVLLVVFVLFIAALVAIPILFKDKLVAFAKETANEYLDATVDFGDFDLSLIRSFPNLNFQIENVTIDGHGTFDNVRLGDIGAVEITIHLMPLINGDVVIKQLGIVDSKFDVRVTADEQANYNIMKETDDEPEEIIDDAEDSDFNLELKRYYFKNIDLSYDDVPLLTKVKASGLNHEGSGDFSKDIFTLSTNTDIAALDVFYDGIKYLNNVRVDAKMDLEIDLNQYKYTLKENQINLNELALGIDGWVAMPEDPIDLDLTFYAKEGHFRHFLSLVPAEFASDLEGVDVTGTLALNGYARGTYTDEAYPGFGLELLVDNGRFKYPDLPASVENIEINCKIDHPGGDLDRMTVNVSRFHLELADNPVDMRLMLKTPMSDPDIDANITANLDFANVQNVIPMEEELSGSLEADVALRGRYSSIEEERYEDFHAAGFMNMRNFRFNSQDGYDVKINEANLNFTPQYAELSRFNLEMDGADVNAQGRLENYLAYALKDSTLAGRLDVQSKKIDLNALMGEDEMADSEEPQETSEDESFEVLEIPANIRFDLNAQIDELIYDDITVSNMVGNIRVADQKLTMNDVKMKVLQGDVTLNGTYDAQDVSKPEVDFAFDARNIDIRQTATTFVSVEKLMPLAKNATGKFSTNMVFQSDLDSEMNPILESIYGKGNFQSKNVFIEGFEPLNELAKLLKIDRLAEQNIEDVQFSFEILEGRAYVEPFDVNIDQVKTTVAGSTGLDQTIDYTLAMKVPTKMLEGGAMDLVQGFMGQAAGLFGQSFSLGESIDVDVLVGGTVEKPTFKPSFGGMSGGQSAVDAAKDVIKEEIDKAKDEAIDRAVEEARDQAAKLVGEAEKQGDRLRAEAKKQADRVRQEGRNAAKKLEDEANNPITKAAARRAGEKLIEEADKNASRIESEADKQAQNVVNEAERQGDKLIQDAETKVRN